MAFRFSQSGHSIRYEIFWTQSCLWGGGVVNRLKRAGMSWSGAPFKAVKDSQDLYFDPTLAQWSWQSDMPHPAHHPAYAVLAPAAPAKTSAAP